MAQPGDGGGVLGRVARGQSQLGGCQELSGGQAKARQRRQTNIKGIVHSVCRSGRMMAGSRAKESPGG